MLKSILTVSLVAIASAQISVPVGGTATIPAGTFETPLIFNPPLQRYGNSVNCPACGSATGTGATYIDLLSNTKQPGIKGGYKNEYVSISPGATLDLLPLVTGAGYVDHLWMANGAYDLEVKVFVDGETAASIDDRLPNLLGGIYGAYGEAAFATQWFSSNSGGPNQQGGYINLPMPFGTSIRITVTNRGSASYTIWSMVTYQTGIPNTWPYTQKLHEVSAENDFCAPNSIFTMLNVSPQVPWRLAGFIWLMDGFNASNHAAPLEGNFKIYIDGAPSPTIESPGSEDMFGMGGYFHGFGSVTNAGDIALLENNGQVFSALRMFIHDPVVGQSSLAMTWNCGDTTQANWTGTAKVQTVVYYYTQN